MAGNPNYDRLLSTTIENYKTTMEDNIFTSKPLLFAIETFGNVETLDGGTHIVQPLMYAELGNQGSYSNGDTFLTDEDEGTTAAVFDWKQYYAVIRLTNIELAKNSGASAVLRIVENEIRRAELSIAESLDQMFLGDGTGNGSKDFNGLANIVSATASLGGIDPTAGGNDWWQSVVQASVGSVSTGFAPLRTNYYSASEGNDFPTNIFTTQALYEDIVALFTPNQRFMDPTMANAGFETVMFESAPISFDRNIAAGLIYGLNLKYITLSKLGPNWFKMSDWVEPANQDIRIKKILLYGQLTCSNRARQFVMSGVNSIA